MKNNLKRVLSFALAVAMVISYVPAPVYATDVIGGEGNVIIVDGEGNIIEGATEGEAEVCEHSYAAVVTEPTCTEAGFTTNTCELCGDVTTTDEVAALGHKYVDGKCECGAEEAVSEDAVVTSDEGEETVVAPELPTATVTEIEKEDLTFALNFKADEATDEQLAYYGGCYADFVLKVNKDVTFNANGGADGYLSGQYDGWSENWVNVPFEDAALKAGESLKIMEYAAEKMGKEGLKITYADVYEGVKDFNCGVFFEPAFLAANPDIEVTLELRMYNPLDESESEVIGKTYTFTYEASEELTVEVKDGVTVESGFAENVSEALGSAYEATGKKLAVSVEATDETSVTYNIEAEGYTVPAEGLEMTLPAVGVDNGKTAYVIHTHGDTKYVYAGTVDANGNISFTNKVGFSEFKVTADGLAAALAADGDIVLGSDIELTEGVTVPAGVTVTLDLAGHKITGTPAEAKAFAVITNKGNLTIDDTVGNGAIVCDHKLAGSTAYAVNTITNTGKLTVKAGTIENKSTASSQIGYAIDNNSTTSDAIVVIEGGEVKASGSNYYDGIRQFCNSETNENIVTVTGGTVSSIWMQNPSDGAADRNTKDVKGSVTIEGGKVNALWLEPSTNFAAAITNGEIGKVAYNENAEGRDLTGFITGGTFSSEVAEEFCAEGFAPVDNGDGTYGVKEETPAVAKIGDTEYTTLEAAFAAANASAEAVTITLLADLTFASDLNNAAKGVFNIADGKTVTLDLNGKKIDVTDNSTGNFIVFYNYGEFTIKNGTVNLTATNDRDWNAESAIVLNRGGVFNVESGTYTHNGGTDMAFVFDNSGNYYGDATTNIKDGTLTSTYVAIRNRMEQNSHGASGKAILNVSGGEISGTSRAIWAQAASTSTTSPATGEINVTGGEVGLIDTPRSTGAESMTTISGGTVAAFKGEVGELKVKGGTLSNVTMMTTAGEPTDYVITADGLYTQAVAQIGEVKYADLHEAMVAAKAGETVLLISDVDLAGTEWEPVSFKGTFDGQDHTISNLTINKPGVSNTGFITSLNGTFKNVTFKNPTVTGGENTGVVAGRAGGSAALAENITVNGTIKVETTHSGYARAGVIVGGWAYGNYINITVDGGDKAVSYIKHTGGGDGRYVAGIVGHADDVESYVNCTVKNITIRGGWLCGGIAGPGPSDDTVTGCTVENIDVNAGYSGGMFGWYYGAGTIKDATIKNVTFTGSSTNNGIIGGYGNNPNANVENVTFENVKNANGAPLLDHVAEVGGEIYFDLQEAVNAGGEVKVLRDVVLADTITIPAGKTVTLNLNGKTISQEKACTASYEMISNKGNLTITGNGKISFKDTGAGDPTFGWGSYTVRNEGTLVVENGTIEHLGQQEFAKHMICAIFQYSGSTTINGGTISTPSYRSARLWKGDMTINGGTFDGQLWVQCVDNSAKLTITGGEFGPNGKDASSVFVGNVTGSNTYTAELKVTGGTFATKFGCNDPSKVTGEKISGGTFGAPVAEGLCAEGYVPVDNGDGTYGVKAGKFVAEVNGVKYETLAEAFAAADGATIVVLDDMELSESVKVAAGKKVTLDLNGKTITGKDTATGNFGLINIDPGAELTLNDSSAGETGKITLTATNDRDWNSYSSVISNQRGKLTVNGGTIEHLGGTDMAYGIDNLTNGKGTYAETVIEGGTVKSTYRAIRQFLNGIEAQNILTINGGTIEGANKSVWMQDPSAKANSGTLTISEDATLKGDVYLFVTAGSTEWPVEVSIAAAALKDGSTVLTGNVPEGYDVKEINGVYGVIEAPELPTATVTEIENEDLTFAMNFKADEASDEQLAFYGDWFADFELTINKDVTFNANGGADGYLSGQYDAWSENWVSVPFEDVTLEANKPLKIMEYAADLMGQSGLKLTYNDVVEFVKDFDCGVFFEPEFLAANPDLKVTLELKMYNPKDESVSYVIGETYTFKGEIVAYNVNEDKVYADLTDALDAAELNGGDTVQLIADVSTGMVMVVEGVTLDLNGNTLTAKYVASFGNVVDNSDDNTGVLAVNANRFTAREDNDQLPVRTAEGYIFVELIGENKALLAIDDETAVKIAFQPLVEPIAHEALIGGSATSYVNVVLRASWKNASGEERTQDFVFPDINVANVFRSYDAETGKYGRQFALTLRNVNGNENVNDAQYEVYLVSGTGVELTYSEAPADNNNQTNNTTEETMLNNGTTASAVVPAGVKVDNNNLALTVNNVSNSESNITLGENEEQKSVDVHIEGVAADNTVPMNITLKNFAATGLNEGNIAMYHVENGATNAMTRVATLEEVDAHNEFYYDAATGDVTMALATFSEVALVENTVNAWNGNFDYSWYTNAVVAADGEAVTEYTIANADQLAAFGAIVGGMNGQTQDSFTGKTVKLVADINLGDKNNANESLIFHPIGYYYYNENYTFEDGTTGKYSTVRSFEGTFDGNGHTIANFYHNTWEIKGDYSGNYYKDAMGLFGYVLNGKVCNLTVDNFSSDGEYTPTGVIAAFADGNSTFENIAITNCNPRVYNTGNGGIIGIAGDTSANDDDHITLKNITVDNSNKISALWGSWDVACGGLVGMYRGNVDGSGKATGDTISFENCHVSAQIDVNNDVCANYQYYAYRYAGMMIGSVRHNITENGHEYPAMAGISASDCTVNFGDWNDYYYCELVANSLASYTHDHQFSRLTEIKAIDGTTITYLDGKIDTVPASGRANYVIVDYTKGHGTDNATCYHFVDGKVHNHNDYNGDGVEDKETVNGNEVYVENNRHIYLEFDQLFTGYGWGVTSKGVKDFEGITTMGITVGTQEESVKKFESKVTGTAEQPYSIFNNTEIKISDLFAAKDGATIINNAVLVTVTDTDDKDGVITAVYDKNVAEGEEDTDWTDNTITLSGTGAATITIQDYNFCTPTTITVNVTERVAAEKFDLVFENTDKYLYRVGNADKSTVKLSSLFKAKDGAEIGDVSVTVEAVNGTAASGTYTANKSEWANGTIQFSGTGVVKVTITDDDVYCTQTVLMLEVVNAVNATTATSATSNNVVLLNDVSGTFSVSGGYTVYGNGFTVTLPTTVQSKFSAGYVGYVTISGGNLDNVRIEGPVYPEMYIYRDQAKDSTDNEKVNYFYNSILINGGNVNISNSYISGSRTAVCIRGGNNVVIENTTLSGGAYANMQIAGASSVTLRDLTTVQVDVPDSYGKSKIAHGLGIAVDSAVVDIYIEGKLNQNNWLNKSIWDKQVPSTYQDSFPDFFGYSKYSNYWHYFNGGTDPYVNLAMIFACNWDTSKIHDNRTTVDYKTCDSTISGVAGGIYSKVNTVGGNAITDTNINNPGYTSPGFNPVAPVFNFDNTANNDADDENDTADTYCVYDEASGVLKIGVSGDSKTIDLSGVSVTKDGITLAHTTYLNDTQIEGNSVTINSADGAKQTLTFKVTSNDVGYDIDGNPIAGSIDYKWTVTVEMAVLSYPAPVWNMGGDYQFDTSNCVYAYYSTSKGYGEAVPIYEGIKVNYYDKAGNLFELDLSGTTNSPTGSNNSNTNAFTYTLTDGSTLTMKFSSGWKSGATTHQFTTYNNKVYIYPQSLDNDNYVRAKKTNQDFDVKITYNFTDPNGQSTGEQTMQWYNAKASNGSVNTVQWNEFDSTNGKEDPTCVTPETLITLADGTQQQVQYLTGEEELLVWNLETGTFDSAPIMFVDSDEATELEVINLIFSDGTKVGVLGEHGFWDYDLNKYVYLDRNAAEYIGHSFAKQSGSELTKVQLVDVVLETRVTTAWSPVTADHLCYFVDGMLSMPGGVGGLFNIFEVDPETMTYDLEAMEKDIETYGLFTYEELSQYAELSEEMFYSAGGPYLKVSIGKGNLTMNELIAMINRYSKFF